MKKQRGVTQAEKEFDAEVAKFNEEARKIMDDRSLSMSARRRLVSLKGKALLRPSASASQVFRWSDRALDPGHDDDQRLSRPI
jgi:hypothetical protein